MTTENRLPVPHPESADILRQQAVVENAVDLGRLIVDAASGRGAAPADGQPTYSHNEYTAHDYSDSPVFHNNFLMEERDIGATLEKSSRTARTPDGGKITVETRDHTVGGSYPLDISRRVVRHNPDGSFKDVVNMKLGWNGQRYKPTAVLTTAAGGGDEVLSKDKTVHLKTELSDAFGLKYDVNARSLPQRPDAMISVDPSAKNAVDSLVTGLIVQGLSGDTLRVEVLKQLHPDRNGDSASTEAFKYASSLDFYAPANIVVDRVSAA